MCMHSFSRSLILGVWLILFPGASLDAAEAIRAVKTEVPPKIDGFIESVWTKADSATEFTQTKPREGRVAKNGAPQNGKSAGAPNGLGSRFPLRNCQDFDPVGWGFSEELVVAEILCEYAQRAPA